MVLNQEYGHTLSDPAGRERVAAAIERGARCAADPLLGVDYFAQVDQPLATIRAAWGLA